MTDEQMYQQWIADRQEAAPSAQLTDRVMASIENRQPHRQDSMLITERLGQSRLIQWAACLAASLIGSLPFLYVAYVAEMLVF